MVGLMLCVNYFFIVLEIFDVDVCKVYVFGLLFDWFDIVCDLVSIVVIGQYWIEQGKQLVMKVLLVVSLIDFNFLFNLLYMQMVSVKVLEKKLFCFDVWFFG